MVLDAFSFVPTYISWLFPVMFDSSEIGNHSEHGHNNPKQISTRVFSCQTGKLTHDLIAAVKLSQQHGRLVQYPRTIDQKSCNRYIGLLGARKCARPVRSTSPHDMTELCSIPEWALSFDVSGLKPLLLSQDIDTSSNRDVGDGMTLHH